ncbi:hypothetical protein DRF67_13125 [Chryseobacterium pennipullorum]|uniref:Uncharacterized protein n=1 Tax=Chryseobacterium pennipullorum TaxID=2258963 RepID=A0A3D9AZS4_9FLAO|nr:hypothetical protein DRF67_13125 [Chryseobacterium pennipullorum]
MFKNNNEKCLKVKIFNQLIILSLKIKVFGDIYMFLIDFFHYSEICVISIRNKNDIFINIW